MQTGVCRWSEACARGHAVGKKAVWLQQKYHTNRLCETCFVGTVERSAKRIVIARKEFKLLDSGTGCNPEVRHDALHL